MINSGSMLTPEMVESELGAILPSLNSGENNFVVLVEIRYFVKRAAIYTSGKDFDEISRFITPWCEEHKDYIRTLRIEFVGNSSDQHE